MAGFPHRIASRPFLLQSRALWALVTSSGLPPITSSPSLTVGGLSGSPLVLDLVWRGGAEGPAAPGPGPALLASLSCPHPLGLLYTGVVACPLSSSFMASPPSPRGSPWVGELDASPGCLILSCSSQLHTFGPMWAWGCGFLCWPLAPLMAACQPWGPGGWWGSQDVPAGCPFRGHYWAHPSCHPPSSPPFPSPVLVLPRLHLPQAGRHWPVFGPRGPSASLYN